MGAEFIGAAIRIDKTRGEAQRLLGEMSKHKLESIYLERNDEPWEDIEWPDEGAKKITIRDHYANLINILYDAASGARRDGALWKIGDAEYVISGGPSWGDAPTDLCEVMWELLWLPFFSD